MHYNYDVCSKLHRKKSSLHIPYLPPSKLFLHLLPKLQRDRWTRIPIGLSDFESKAKKAFEHVGVVVSHLIDSILSIVIQQTRVIRGSVAPKLMCKELALGKPIVEWIVEQKIHNLGRVVVLGQKVTCRVELSTLEVMHCI